MIKISAIVAASENNCIGNKGDLPWHIPGDMKRLKAITMGKPLIMGRKTHEGISSHRGGKPLPGRTHYVISTTMETPDNIDGVFVNRSLEEAITSAKEYAATQKLDEIIIFGGAQIYELALPLTDKIYLTRVHLQVEGDAFFPELDMNEWNVTNHEEHQTEDESIRFDYITLEKTS